MTGLSWEALVFLALLTITPGPDTILTLRQALAGGFRLAFATAAGISTGTIIHGTIAGLGLAIVLREVPAAFRVVQFAGVAYLAFLGLRSLWTAWRGGGMEVEVPARLSGYRDGLATNLLNPKVALFYLGFLPQFIGPDEPFLLLSVLYGASHALMGMVWLSAVALGAHRLRGRLTQPKVRRGVEVVAGLIFLGFAVRLALGHA